MSTTPNKLLEPKRYFLLRYEGLAMVQTMREKLQLANPVYDAKLLQLLDHFTQQLQTLLITTLQPTVPTIAISFHTLEELEEGKQRILGTIPAITLDSYSRLANVFPLGVSRLYDENGEHKICVGARPGYESVEKQIQNLLASTPIREFILVDDDIWTGGTMKDIRNLLEKNGLTISGLVSGIQVVGNEENIEAQAVVQIEKAQAFDIADPRDFLIGSQEGGLGILFANGVSGRAPYFKPFTNPTKHVGVPGELVIPFSKKLLEMNLEFYTELENITQKQIRIEHLWPSFVTYIKEKYHIDESSAVIPAIEHLLKNIK